ncbi:MAG: glutamate--tRNA ligase [Gammaproteobacteria bacterium RIFCSPHIGHO2_12_FULL_38_14]|nr:MAG: glutamate--tRNA ligase [Gammaproteobacteria bacterium RIFCSPHIGHO2_12_FULL_38_14]
MTVRTRFSPSPTGNIHLGNARAALFSALFAKKNNGVFILRIEDTDLSRSQEQYIESLQQDLHWLDINWQEGPGVDGSFGPYRQSERADLYTTYYEKLEHDGLVYPCFCTDQELLLARKMQLAQGQPPRYLGTCRHLSDEAKATHLAAGKKPAWRFIIQQDAAIEFVDIVKGPQRFINQHIGDFIIRRADGTFPFLFSNAIDDALMQVTHVLRGEDHLANTPRQLMLLRALKLHEPQYGHLSLILGDDGAPLSKRHGSYSVDDMHRQGYLPLAVINYLAHLGHTADVQTLLSFDELAKHFHLDKLSKSPARFDVAQLMFWQKMAVQSMDTLDLCRWIGEENLNQVPEDKRLLFVDIVKSNIEFPRDALQWAKIFFHELAPIEPAYLHILREAGEQFFVEAGLAVDQYGTDFDRVLKEMKQTLGVSGKKLFMPLRIALTGKEHGPELALIATLLGEVKLKHRLGHAVHLINQ